MATRSLLVGLILLATIGFVVGVSIEKADNHHEPATTSTEAGHHSVASGDAGHSEGREAHAAHSEFRPLGIDLEETPLLIFAAVGSLLLAAAAWLQPRLLPLLLLAFVAMGIFGGLDIAEVVHQADNDETGLAVLAALVGVLHLAAAFVALRMAEDGRHRPARRSASFG